MLAAVGQPVPDTAHAVSVSLPTWKATVGYEEGEEWVLSKMKTGYPRFFIHLIIQELEREVLSRYGRPGEAVMLFPSPATAKRCQQFFDTKLDGLDQDLVRIIALLPSVHSDTDVRENRTAVSSLFCVFFPQQHFSVAKQVWQHSGDGISSRRGEFCLKALRDGLLIPEGEVASTKHHQDQFCKGPRRYQRGGSQSGINGISHASKPPTDSAASVEVDKVRDGKDLSQFVEERFGRNLNAELASKAKVAVRRRIAGCLTDDSELDQALEAPTDGQSRRINGLTEDDVYLYPTGMSSIFNTHRILLACREEPRKSICFGFPYIDTLKILEKWGPGCLFYGNGWDSDLDDLERRLESGERYLALFTEFPSNPLLNSPDLPRMRQLADKYDFALVVDESVGNFINVNVLAHADVVVSSLTKAFSGDSNVMGGSAVLNPYGRMYQTLKKTLSAEYEDNYWAEDAVFLERNSRDFISRIERINVSAEAIAEKLHSSSLVKRVYYPKYSPTRGHYDQCRNPGGGYGGLLSVTFNQVEQAVAFFDALEVQKGPSLGTNFTLSCPYTILAHYGELEWAASFGVEADLIRISFGLEDRQDLEERVERALNAAKRPPTPPTIGQPHSHRSTTTMAWRCTGRTNAELISNLFDASLITSPRVRAAMSAVDRAHFCPSPSFAYEDSPQSIGYGATISAPHMHASAAESLLPYIKPDRDCRILDIGSGSGYLTAVLAHLIGNGPGSGKVVGIEHIEPLAKMGRENMAKSAQGRAMLESGRVEFVVGDGRKGYPAAGPYDVIHVGAAAKELHPELVEQLKAPGRMFIPIEDEGGWGSQYIWVVDKDEKGEVVKKRDMGVRYVPLTDAPK